ncbi:hypothetical protein BG842_26295 [Haladaptatus sp. W1]|nr:aldehyde dehydrogenase family protein [Haladaptatus sp. W1]ODR83086.1 hypothetical protein BG842_26295 [Haladaptatus sp. W1]
MVDEIYDKFADRVTDIASDLTVTNGLDDDAEMGPLITSEHQSRVEQYIQEGIDDGATLLVDGRTLETLRQETSSGRRYSGMSIRV